MDFEIEVPPNAVFEADIGLEKIRTRRRPHPRRVHFRVRVSQGEGFETLVSSPVLFQPSEGNAWNPVRVDLASYAGQRLWLRLEVTPEEPLSRRTLAWWGSPRIVMQGGGAVKDGGGKR